MGDKPQISVVIATHNRRDSLFRTLQTLFNQDVPPDVLEIIAVVDGSIDGTADALRKLRPPCALRVLERPRGGISAARNDGIWATSGDIILILDDDVLCEPDLIRQHIAAHKDSPPQVVVGAFPISSESPHTLVAEAFRDFGKQWSESFERNHSLRWPYDAAVEPNTSVHRAVFEKFGAFDESLPYQREDSEIGMRFWLKGVPFRCLPTAVAHHVVVKKTRDMLSRDAELFGKHDLRLARQYPEYRPFSVPARIAQGPWRMRAARRIIAALPFSPAPVISAALWPLERLQSVKRLQRVGVKLLQYGSSAVSIRSAAREAGSWQRLRQEFGKRLPVFMFHHIGEAPKPWVPGLSIPPAGFERQIRWLARRGFESIRPADWLAWLREGKPLPEKPILLTFDDAYADLAQFALPVLQRYGFTGVVFVVTGQIGQTGQWGMLADYPPMKLMDAGQIRHWARQGIEFGAHSRTHRDLARLPLQSVEQEISGSGKDLEELLQTRINSFAYPYGSYDAAAREVARRTFDLCFGVLEGMNDLGSNLHALCRTMILPVDSGLALWLKSRFGFNPAARFLARLRRPIIRTFFGSGETSEAPDAT